MLFDKASIFTSHTKAFHAISCLTAQQAQGAIRVYTACNAKLAVIQVTVLTKKWRIVGASAGSNSLIAAACAESRHSHLIQQTMHCTLVAQLQDNCIIAG